MVKIARPNHLPRFSDPAPNAPARALADVPVPVNVGYLFAMGRDEFFQLNGTPWRVPPVPALVGAELYRLKAIINNAKNAEEKQELTEQQHRDFALTVARLIVCMTQCLRPIRKRDKLLRALRMWHPLKRASDGDLRLLLDFLLACRAKSTIQYRPATN